ncbi:TRMT1-like protein isoform X3 [Engystomops pustulosus]|uniref:TRMT1-like protein isoform X3 n=1 Tax=Engystomops pustulosus TaxID=76066 RepID=UPI003AFA3052
MEEKAEVLDSAAVEIVEDNDSDPSKEAVLKNAQTSCEQSLEADPSNGAEVKNAQTSCEESLEAGHRLLQEVQSPAAWGSHDPHLLAVKLDQADPSNGVEVKEIKCEDNTEGEHVQSEEPFIEEPCSDDPGTEDGESVPLDGEKVSLDLENAVKHISIQKELSDLEGLVQQSHDDKKPCPLCPESKFRSCHISKLHRHLQNLHWKVSVEFEGYRMCICFLPCVQNMAQNENEIPGKMSSHYHCIICSAVVNRRRTDMVRHIKRHVEKGETEVTASYSKPQEILQESNTEVQVLPNSNTPQKSGTFFNPVMKTNRQLIFCALAVLAKERQPLECLDAFSSTGIMGLQWAKHLGDAVKVTLNDISETSISMIRENCHLNKIRVVTESDGIPEEESDVTNQNFVGTIEVTQMDANVLMHLRSFDFIHLDPFGTSVNYLDAAFRNIRNLGIVSVTSTDTSSLYAKTVHVAKRHYGCNIIRTEYYRELAARVVLSAVARAAARCNKGIEVLLSVALEHFVLVIVRVLRGPSLADETSKMINNLIHCHWCEERIFQKEGNMIEESPYKLLPCDCHKSMPGRSAVLLGPVWSSSLFNTGFLRRMLFEAFSQGISEVQPILKTLLCESESTTTKQFSGHTSQGIQAEDGVFIRIPEGDVSAVPGSGYIEACGAGASAAGKRKHQGKDANAPKRLKGEVRSEHPPFYYSIHRHAIGGLNLPKLNKILQYLSEAGFLVSRTHFDPTGIRTNASLATLIAILKNKSTLSNTSQISSYREGTDSQSEDAFLQDAASLSDMK